LQDAAGPLTDRDYVWHKERAVAVPVAKRPERGGAGGFRRGRAAPRVISDLVHRGVWLPRFGAFVAMGQDAECSLAFHYWFDVGWSEDAVDALFDLLAEIRATAPWRHESASTRTSPKRRNNAFVAAIDAASAGETRSRPCSFPPRAPSQNAP
jgi:hypothetical protein